MSTVSSRHEAEEPRGLEAFKQAFRRHAAGVAIVTATAADGSPVGFTATSLASLAADPPLATFNMARTASTWPTIESTERAVIHMLGVRNRDLAQKLSGPHEKRFEGEHWHRGPHGLPVLDGVTCWMSGRIVSRTSLGNAAVVIVEIENGALGEPDDALLYHEREYMTPQRFD